MVLEIKVILELIRKKVKMLKNIRMIQITISLAPKITKKNSRIKNKISYKPLQGMASIRDNLLKINKA